MNDESNALPPPPERESRLHRFVSSFGHLVQTMVEMGFTRLELIFVELQEWIEGLVRVLFWAIVMTFAAGMALLLGSLALIFAFWDNRVLVALLEMGVFVLLVIGAIVMIRKRLRVQRSLLSATLAEFAKDRELLKRNSPPDAEPEEASRPSGRPSVASAHAPLL